MLETVLTPTSARATTMAAFPAGAGRLLSGLVLEANFVDRPPMEAVLQAFAHCFVCL